MNRTIMQAAGFYQELAAIDQGKCPFCHEVVDKQNGFRDELSRKEFVISGLCQKCQDKMFGDSNLPEATRQ